MSHERIYAAVYEMLCGVPLFDVHTHLVGGALGARGLHDILLYHMAVSDLYAAGCPEGARLTEHPGVPSREEAQQRILSALPHLDTIRNTSTSWGIRCILEELYGWRETITGENWQRLDDLIRERATDRVRHHEILKRGRIQGVGTELARRGDASDDALLQYALEWAFFTRCQWGEYDTALYELERCWGEAPGAPSPIGAGKRGTTRRQVRTLGNVHEAIAYYVDCLCAQPILSTATHFSTDLDLRPVTDAEMDAALANRDHAGFRERNVYAAYINEAFLTAFEKKNTGIVFQFSLGAEPLPFETASRLTQGSIAQIAEMIGRHPGIRFQCFLGCAHANQALCTLCRELPNLSLAGYWWHNFFPPLIRQIMEERLDMLPVNKQIGFFSDAYCVEWTHAKLMIVRRCLAQVLGEKIEAGQYTMADAEGIAKSILFESPQTLLGFRAAGEEAT